MKDKKNNEVHIDLETTGLDSCHDEIIEIAVVNEDGDVLLDSLVKPIAHASWDDAQKINGISPDMVSDAPTLECLHTKIISVFKDADVIIYNAEFDAGFLGELLHSSRSVKCCMRAFSEFSGEWSERHGELKRHKLTNAADFCGHVWESNKHRALGDAQASRAVWKYITDQSYRNRCKENTREKEAIALTKEWLKAQEADFSLLEDRKRKMIQSFIFSWWLNLDINHPSLHWASELSKENAEKDLALIFYNQSLHSIKIENSFNVIYRKQRDIPDHLKPASFFEKALWYQDELIPCAAFIGNIRAWTLYDIKEKVRLKHKWPYRIDVCLPENTEIFTKSELLKKGYSEADVDKLTIVAERQNPYSFSWYYLYVIDPA